MDVIGLLFPSQCTFCSFTFLWCRFVSSVLARLLHLPLEALVVVFLLSVDYVGFRFCPLLFGFLHLLLPSLLCSIFSLFFLARLVVWVHN